MKAGSQVHSLKRRWLLEAEQIYPMAYLVEADANASLEPHLHISDQLQVFVDGEGLLGTPPSPRVAMAGKFVECRPYYP